VATQERIDRLLARVQVVDVFRLRVFSGWLAIRDGRFVYVEEGDPPRGMAAQETIDGEGAFIVPGLIDTHMHIESSHMLPSCFAEAVLPQGTTAVLADPHEIANLAGEAGVQWMMSATSDLPLAVYFASPSVVPIVSPELETPNAVLDAAAIERICEMPRVLSIGEVHDFRSVAAGEPRFRELERISLRTERKIEGHIPELRGCDLSRYVALGVTSDHTLFSSEQLLEELTKGVYVMLQRKALNPEIVSRVTGLPDRSRILLVTDDVSPAELLEGHVLANVNRAIEFGLPPLEAIASATIRAATYLGCHRRGAIAPGRRADFWLTRSLDALQPTAVFVDGEPVAEGGRILPGAVSRRAVGVPPSAPAVPGPITSESLRLMPSEGSTTARRITARAIELLSQETSATGLTEVDLDVVDGTPQWMDDDLSLITVISRSNPDSRSVAVVKGFGLRTGAVATSVAHDTHNLVIVGRDPLSMVTAANEVHRLGGGIVFASQDTVGASLPLPILGLLSDADLSTVVDQAQSVEHAMKEHGIRHREPLLMLTLLALSVSPQYKLSDRGIVDVNGRRILAPTVHEGQA